MTKSSFEKITKKDVGIECFFFIELIWGRVLLLLCEQLRGCEGSAQKQCDRLQILLDNCTLVPWLWRLDAMWSSEVSAGLRNSSLRSWWTFRPIWVTAINSNLRNFQGHFSYSFYRWQTFQRASFRCCCVHATQESGVACFVQTLSMSQVAEIALFFCCE